MGRATIAIVGLLLAAAVAVGAFLLVEGRPSDGERTPTEAQPSETSARTESPFGRGRDIGLGFPVCDVQRLKGIDLLGDGTKGSAWTASRVTDGGRCDRSENSYLVAADVTGDGRADASWGQLVGCFVCRPFGATDFDGDGAEELVVLVSGGSVAAYQVLSAEEASDGSIDFDPVPVAPPGNRKGDLPAGEPLRMWAGGDEGFTASIACDRYPDDPILIVAWSDHPVEGPGSETTEIHITRLVLRDGSFHVVNSVNTEQPTAFGPDSNESLPKVFSRRGRECGLRFHLS